MKSIHSHRDEIIAFANDLLELHEFPDYGPMGVQFLGSEKVTKVCTAVSVSKEIIERTADAGAQMLIVHHGMFWNNESRLLDSRIGGRIEALQAHGITLLAYHLALDAHERIGNNRLAAKTLGLKKLKRFEEIGWGGEYKTPMDHPTFLGKVYDAYGDHYNIPNHYLYGDKKICRVAVIVGGAPQYIVQAQRKGYDTFFTGETAEPTIYLAQDLGMNFIAAGHDRTERAGVKQLGKILNRKFLIKTEFLEQDLNIV